MIAFPDTSFLCALYVQQDNSPAAATCFKAMPEVLHISGLLFETVICPSRPGNLSNSKRA